MLECHWEKLSLQILDEMLKTYLMPRSSNTLPSTPHLFYFSVPLSLYGQWLKPLLWCGWDAPCCVSYDMRALYTPLMWLGCSVLFFLWQESSASEIPTDTNDDSSQRLPVLHFKPRWPPPPTSPAWSQELSPRSVKGTQSRPASGGLWWLDNAESTYPLDWTILWFGFSLSKLMYPLVTTRGISYNVIKIIISMRNHCLASTS